MNDPDAMKAISESRLRVAIRTAFSLPFIPHITPEFEHALTEGLVEQVSKMAVEIQRPDTVLKSEYDLVVAKNQTLVQLMELMTAQLNAKSNSLIESEASERGRAKLQAAAEHKRR